MTITHYAVVTEQGAWAGSFNSRLKAEAVQRILQNVGNNAVIKTYVSAVTDEDCPHEFLLKKLGAI